MTNWYILINIGTRHICPFSSFFFNIVLEIQNSSIKAKRKRRKKKEIKCPSDQEGRIKSVPVASDVKLNVGNPKEFKKINKADQRCLHYNRRYKKEHFVQGWAQ